MTLTAIGVLSNPTTHRKAPMRYLLDTNICIYLMQHRPASVVERLKACPSGSVAMSVVTYAELCAGIARQTDTAAQNQRALARLTERIPVLPFDIEAAQRYGQDRAFLPDRRRHAMDRLIAAHAASRGWILVTNNTADFIDYPALTIENWVE